MVVFQTCSHPFWNQSHSIFFLMSGHKDDMTGRRPRAKHLSPRHNIHSPVYSALFSHPSWLLPPLKVTWELRSSPQFSKQVICTGVTLQHAREEFWRHKDCISRQNIQCVFALLIHTLGWHCENTSKGQGMNGCFVLLSSLPATCRTSDVAVTGWRHAMRARAWYHRLGLQLVLLHPQQWGSASTDLHTHTHPPH